MADAFFKPSSGDDLVLSNDDASKKIEIPESGDVEVTGDFKTTTVKTTNIKDQANANSAITIASDGQITINQNNPTLTLGSNTTFHAGNFIKTPVNAILGDNVSRNNAVGTSTVLTASISVDSTSDRILAVFTSTLQMWGANTTTEPKGTLIFKDDTGSGTTLYSNLIEDSFPANSNFCVYGPLCSSHIVTPSATGTNTFKIEIAQTTTSAGRILVFGNNDTNMVNPTQILLYYIKG